jgi:hypothetical protein
LAGPNDFKIRENRARRAADRQGYELVKSRSRDPRVPDFGLYALVNSETGEAVNPMLLGRWDCSWTIDNVEDFLAGPDWLNDPVVRNADDLKLRTMNARLRNAINQKLEKADEKVISAILSIASEDASYLQLVHANLRRRAEKLIELGAASESDFADML